MVPKIQYIKQQNKTNMKKFLTLFLTLISTITFACHTTNLTLISGPTNIGGGQYQTVVQACFGQYTAGNWGGTNNFNFTISGATYVSFSPANITNSYNAYTAASCAGPNCFMSTCAAISATATGSMISSTVVQYSTTSSTPAGYNIVPDDNESCAGTPTSFCFNFTFVTNGYPTSISLNGNIEAQQPRVCRAICGFPNTYAGGPCNGSYDADMTITFTPLPIELVYFNGYVNDGFNLIEWVSATETNNNYYTLERSIDGYDWDVATIINGSGNSSTPIRYDYRDYSYKQNEYNYYRLSQTDFNGDKEIFEIIVVDNRSNKKDKTLVKILTVAGTEIEDITNYTGVLIYYYSDGSYSKVCKLN